MDYLAAFGLVAHVARHDDHSSSWQRLANGFKSFAPDDDVMAHRQLAESLQIGGQSPGEFVVNADPALFVHSRNDRNNHTDTSINERAATPRLRCCPHSGTAVSSGKAQNTSPNCAENERGVTKCVPLKVERKL